MKSVFDKIVCVSSDIKRRFNKQFGFKNEILTVIHNGVFAPDIKKKMNRDVTFKIGTAGRLFPVKDFKLFINIAHRILQNEKNVIFLLAGEGPEIEKLKKLVDGFQIADKVKFLGHLENMIPFYSGLDLYMNTSIHEGIPMSVLEAMAFGVPVVAPKTGGLCEIVEDKKNGYLINSRDADEFANVSISIIKNRELHKRLSNAACERVRTTFSTEHMAECYYRLYRELCYT
jgi:glycosyltransferase involved in cell wall biosynthesis